MIRLFVCITILFVITSENTEAVVFSPSERISDNNCIVEMRGPINEGDDILFEKFLRDMETMGTFGPKYFQDHNIEYIESLPDGFHLLRINEKENGHYELAVINAPAYKICLDSPGGSLETALKIGQMIQKHGFGSQVSSDAICESACAVVFLFGRFKIITGTGGVFDQIDRTLHAGGKLGFHAPSLNLEEGTIVPVTLVSEAYNDSIALLAEILDHLPRSDMSVLTNMMTTPNDDMYYYDKIIHLNELNMDLGRIKIPFVDKSKKIENICSNNFEHHYFRNSDEVSGCDALGFNLLEVDEEKSQVTHGSRWCWKTSEVCNVKYSTAEEIEQGEPAIKVGYGDPYEGDFIEEWDSAHSYWVLAPETQLDKLRENKSETRISWARMRDERGEGYVRAFFNDHGFYIQTTDERFEQIEKIYLGRSCDAALVRNAVLVENEDWKWSVKEDVVDVNIGSLYSIVGMKQKNNGRWSELAEKYWNECRKK